MKYNDYELLYLIKRHSNEAFEILLLNYGKLVVSRLKCYSLSDDVKEEIVQDCLMLISEAIVKFDEYKDVLFFTYIDCIIKRKISKFFRSLYRDVDIYNGLINQRVFLIKEDSFGYNKELSKMKVEHQLSSLNNNLTLFEKKVLDEILLNGMSNDEFNIKYDSNSKRIYNCKQSIKKKFNYVLERDKIK